MLSRTYSVAAFGIDLLQISVEVNVFERGFPGFDIIGLPGKEISESKERITAALKNSGVSMSGKKILVNLAPADIPKEGSSYDMPIAAGLISALLNVAFDESILMYGEVSLDGSITYTKRALLPIIFGLSHKYEKILIPKTNAEEILELNIPNVYGIAHISELIRFINTGDLPSRSLLTNKSDRSIQRKTVSIDEIIGQEYAKRALEVSAAGGHNLFFEGSPGSGKSMLSKAYINLLPDLGFYQAVEVTKIHSIAGAEENLIWQNRPPYRVPHHTISYAGMLGGNSIPRPGEVSLAHNGVLFMDEFPEFSRQVIEALRQPLEEGISVINRSKATFIFPSRFTLLAACNPCPCGFYGHPTKPCSCTPQQIQKYRSKLSGPILDRIDMLVNVRPVEVEKLVFSDKQFRAQEIEIEIKKRISDARNIQSERFKNSPTLYNSRMSNEEIEKYCSLDNDTRQLMKKAVTNLGLSARTYYKVLKVARTIADLENSDEIQSRHIAESLQYRR